MKYLTLLFCLFSFAFNSSVKALPVKKTTHCLVNGELIKEVHLNLVLLDGEYDNPLINEKRHECDAQFISLAKGEKLHVILHKVPHLFYPEASQGGIGYDIESNILVRDWDGWIHYLWNQKPLQFAALVLEEEECNHYYYETTQVAGRVDLSFISHTYPRYYSQLQVDVK